MNSKPPQCVIILVNLGTPDKPTPKAVRKFLKEFLSDSRVVEVPKLLWWLILRLVILPFRPAKVAQAYQLVWQEDSPLRMITQQQADALQERFPGHIVRMGMTYGKPALEEVIKKLVAEGKERFMIFPLYPQYSATTTGPVFDKIAKISLSSRNIPEFRILKSYYNSSSYINALVKSIETHWQHNIKGDKLLFSFHGIPKLNVEKGDPYQQHCEQTASLVAEKLGLSAEQWLVCYQSRLGKAEWLKPYTDLTLQQLAREEIKGIDVICPAFAADCLETLEEIAVSNKKLFINSGGERFSYIKALNVELTHIDMMERIVKNTISDWL